MYVFLSLPLSCGLIPLILVQFQIFLLTPPDDGKGENDQLEEGMRSRNKAREQEANIQFTRKSVEGLSIFLFFFAFCGNLTYVASILLNPAGSASPSDAGHYLLEALPYVPFSFFHFGLPPLLSFSLYSLTMILLPPSNLIADLSLSLLLAWLKEIR